MSFWTVDNTLNMAPFDVIKEEFLRQIRRQKLDEVATHGKKIADVSETLNLTRSSEKSKKLCKPLEGKLQELIAQRDEFQSACDALIRKVTNSQEIQQLEICGGIFRRECKKLAAALPMYAHRSHILKTIKDTQVCIILGETGSGKSTQVPLYLLEDCIGKQKLIVCTQPRKVAAMSLAKYVSSEMGCTLGSTVGHHVGREPEADKSTELLYMTDHRLLNECLRDPNLSQYSCVIVDEAHERSIYTDLLLGMIKKCLVKRPDLKVIITSATIDPDIFVKYFGGCPVLRVPGRLYPVDVIYKKQPRGPQDNYLSEAIEQAKSVHLTEEPGDILVFLATPAETELACNTFANTCDSIVCLQLHGKLQPEEQQKVFEAAPQGQRKVIFSTNVAETSVTIPGVKYVIDTGMCKEKTYDARRNMGVLEFGNISRSSADQRKGTAGRTAAGKCFRLFTEMEFEGFVKTSAPEILRVHLGQALLKLMELGVEDPLSFDFVEPPTTAAMVGAMEALCEIGAVTEASGKLTELGSNLSKLTLEPRLAKFVLEGARTDFPLESILTAAYVCSGSNAYYRAGSKEEKAMADALKTNFCHEDGDFRTFLNVYREWQKGENEKERREWCFANNINAKTMKTVYQQVNDIRFEMRRHLGIEVGMQFRDDISALNEVFARHLLTCYPSQLCYFSGHLQAGYFLSTGEACYHVHPSSALRYLGQTPKWVIYNQLLKTSQDFMLNLTVVSDDMVQQQIKEGLLKIDEAYLQGRMVTGEEVPNIGTHLLRSLAGPRHTVRRSLEEKISQELGGKPVVIDLDFQNVTAMVYTSAGCHPVAQRAIQEFLMNERTKLVKEKLQEAVGPDNPICTIIGSGGSVEQLLMPGEFRVFHLNTPPDTFSESLQEMFESFGEVEISDFRRTKAQDRDQGRLTYSSAVNAGKAFQYACELEDCTVWREKTADRTRVSSAFSLKLSWIRRPNKGCAFIKCGNDEAARRVFDILTRSRGLNVLGHPPTLKFRAQGDIRIDNIDARLSNTVITDRIKHLLVSSGYNGDPPEVRVPRESGFLTTSVDIEHYKEKLGILITDIGKTTDFYVVMREPRNAATVEQIAWVNFQDVNAGARVLTELEYTEPHLRYISRRLVGNVVVSSRVKTVLQSSLSQCQAELSTVDREMTMKSTQRGNWLISISAKSVELYAEMKKSVDQIIFPEIIDCFDENCVQAQLLHPESEQFLRDVERETETCISVDKRCKRVNITGTTGNKERAKTKIEDHLKTLKPRFTERIKLTGPGFPRSMLRTFLQRYGIQLDDLITRCQLQSVRLDIPRQILVAVGDNEAVANVRQLVEDMKHQLQEDGEKNFSEDQRPDCSVCFCPADNLYRLNSCGHPYCFTCLTSLISSAINNSEFPLICSQEQCPDPLLLKDIREVIGASFEKLAKSSVACYVKQQGDKARYCTTPDCDSVYRVTTESSSFTCPVCFIQICAACGLRFHEGLTCEQNKYENTEEKEHVQRWLNEDKSRRALCPGCKTRIEKTGGCNRMVCSRCNAIFCWVCKLTFSSEGACYDHLSHSCGGIFPNQVY